MKLRLTRDYFSYDEFTLRGAIAKMGVCDSLPLQRSRARIVDATVIERTDVCTWFDLKCFFALDDWLAREKVQLDEFGYVHLRTAIPRAGVIVEETTRWCASERKEIYTYLQMDEEASIKYASTVGFKMNMRDQCVYNERFHLLSPFSALYTAACVDTVDGSILFASGTYQILRIIR